MSKQYRYKKNGRLYPWNRNTYTVPIYDDGSVSIFNKAIIKNNAQLDGDQPLQSLRFDGGSEYTRGNISQQDIDKAPLPFYHSVASYKMDHPGAPVWRIPNKGDNFWEAELVKDDYSNILPDDSFTTVDPRDQTGAMFDTSIQPTYYHKRLDINDKKDAAGVLTAYDYLVSAMKDWKSALRGSNWLNGFYDEYSRQNISRDADQLARIIGNANGDAETALENLKGVSHQTSAALYSILGHRMPPDLPWDKRGALLNDNLTRFFNAYNKIKDLYNTGSDQPSTAPTMPRDKFGDDYIRQQALESIRLPNSYSRGGRMRTAPKSFRSPNGYRVGKADGMGDDEYDVYF